MEYTVVAKVSYREHGDDYDKYRQVELGDMEIDSKEAIESVAETIASELKIQDGLHYKGFGVDYPKSHEFYLETTPIGDYHSTDMYKVELVDCIKIKGRLFTLKPFYLWESEGRT